MAQIETEYRDLGPAEPSPRGRWPLAQVMLLDLVLILALSLLLATAAQLAFLILRASQQGISLLNLRSLKPDEILRLLGGDGLLISVLVQNLVWVLGPVLRVRLLRREPLADIGLQARGPLRLVLIGVGIGVVVLVGNMLVSLLLNAAGIRQNQADQYPLFKGDYVGQALFFLAAAVVAPVGEEILFRGYVFNAIRQTFASRSWGLALAFVGSAAGFSLAHSLAATRDLIGLLIPTFLMGLALAWGVYRTGSVLPGIIAHAMNNGLALMVLVMCVNGTIPCPTR